jgi:hypothetical protein
MARNARQSTGGTIGERAITVGGSMAGLLAALEALALRECLAAETERLAERFFTHAGKIIDVAWSITVGNDRRLVDTYRATSLGVRFINWYMDKLLIAARTDPEVAWAFLKVANFLAAPGSILLPPIALRVARAHLQGWRMAGSWWGVASKAKVRHVTLSSLGE